MLLQISKMQNCERGNFVFISKHYEFYLTKRNNSK